jgi:hypothetical protein
LRDVKPLTMLLGVTFQSQLPTLAAVCRNGSEKMLTFHNGSPSVAQQMPAIRQFKTLERNAEKSGLGFAAAAKRHAGNVRICSACLTTRATG